MGLGSGFHERLGLGDVDELEQQVDGWLVIPLLLRLEVEVRTEGRRLVPLHLRGCSSGLGVGLGVEVGVGVGGDWLD